MTALFDLADTEMADNLGSCIDDAARAQRVLNDAKADHALGFAIDHAKAVGGRDGLRWLRRSGQKIAAAEAEILAEHVRDDGNPRGAENLLADGKTSRREQRRHPHAYGTFRCRYRRARRSLATSSREP